MKYSDKVVEAAIINLLEDADIDGGDKNFVGELQKIFEKYVAGAKYGKQIV